MKASWRLTKEQLPSDDREVLGIFMYCKKLCYFDGDIWVDSISEIIITPPIWWMHIPLTPGE